MRYAFAMLAVAVLLSLTGTASAAGNRLALQRLVVA